MIFIKENANDGNGGNASVGIGTKIKRIVTAGLLFTSLATGGAGAIQQSNVPGGNVTEQMHPPMPNRAMPPPLPSRELKREGPSGHGPGHHSVNFSESKPPPHLTELNPFQKTKAMIEEHAKKMNFTDKKRLSPEGPDPHHH
ncbi:hypothetical protein niasHT_001685 [Heterodera trifolii]|uniref:Uncharacterized protein n=1 Tax=Heterodera trifolii TaxID=157864 RepID=A0ABD2M4D1_9BILA